MMPETRRKQWTMWTVLLQKWPRSPFWRLMVYVPGAMVLLIPVFMDKASPEAIGLAVGFGIPALVLPAWMAIYVPLKDKRKSLLAARDEVLEPLRLDPPDTLRRALLPCYAFLDRFKALRTSSRWREDGCAAGLARCGRRSLRCLVRACWVGVVHAWARLWSVVAAERAAVDRLTVGTLCDRVVRLCDDLVDVVPANVVETVYDIRRRLCEPLRVAVAGRVSTGKSTLVNALLGVPVCQTGDVETTQAVTWFFFGDVERVELVLRNGARRRSSLSEEGRLPASFGVAPQDIARVSVQLPQAPLLRDLTLIDTPGTESALTASSALTRDAFFVRASLDAVAQADALIFVLKGLESDVFDIEAFGELTAGVHSSLVNTIGVVNGRGDGDGAGPGELRAHARVAERLMRVERIRRRVIDVVPVLGLIAQAARCNLLTLDDLAGLEDVVGHPDFDDDLEYAPTFLSRTDALTAERQRLFALLGPTGLRAAADLADGGVLERERLTDRLLTSSGLERLQQRIVQDFVPRADAIKADQALARLQRCAFQLEGTASARMLDAVERVTLDPSMHGLREMWALAQYASGDVVLPARALQLLRRTFGANDVSGDGGPTPIELTDTAAVDELERLGSSPRLNGLAREVIQIMIRAHHLHTLDKG